MARVEERLAALGLVLPEPLKAPAGAVLGMVSSAPGLNRQPNVINGFSDLIIEVFGPSIGAHSRSAVGMAELPFDIPVEIEGEVELQP